jgi:hypothetical protein
VRPAEGYRLIAEHNVHVERSSRGAEGDAIPDAVTVGSEVGICRGASAHRDIVAGARLLEAARQQRLSFTNLMPLSKPVVTTPALSTIIDS